MEWDNESVIQLIEEYQKHRILWDAKDPTHFSKIKKNDAWEAIAKTLSIDADEGKKKMSSLLGSFRREKSRIKQSYSTGNARKDVYQSKWFAFEAMQFLTDKNEPRCTLNTENNSEIDDTEHLSVASANVSEDISLSEIDEVNSTAENVTTNKSTFDIPRQTKRKKKDIQTEDPRIETAFNFLTTPIQPPDTCSTFGTHVANKLRSIESPKREIVEHLINSVFFDVAMGKYDYMMPSVVPPYTTPQQNNQPSASFTLFEYPPTPITSTVNTSTHPSVPENSTSSEPIDFSDILNFNK